MLFILDPVKSAQSDSTTFVDVHQNCIRKSNGRLRQALELQR